MSDNYTLEFPLLQKLLQTEAFRFVIIRFNHYSLVQRVESDLRRLYPDRPLVSVDAGKIEFSELLATYQNLTGGLVLIENFQLLLKEQTTYDGEETPAMQIENERRRAITTGLNLRRDKLAKIPNALIVFVMASHEEKYLRAMMEKMPDLWSFRSLYLDLEREKAPVNTTLEAFVLREETDIGYPSVSKGEFAQNAAEIARLQEALATSETTLALSLYPQLTRLLLENGIYDQALIYFEEWLAIASEAEKGLILFNKGNALINMGDLSEALAVFQIALAHFMDQQDKRQEGLCHLRMGDILLELGNLPAALAHFQAFHKIEQALVREAPNDWVNKYNLAVSYSRLGSTQSDLGNLEKALHYFEERTRLGKELYGTNPQQLSLKKGLSISYAKLGETEQALGNLESALRYFDQFNQLEQELYASNPQNASFKYGLAISYSRLGSTQSDLGNLEAALRYFEKETHLFEELYDAYPQNIRIKYGLASSYSRLGPTQRALGNLEEAVRYFNLDIQLSKEIYEAYPQNVSSKNGLAVSYANLGVLKEMQGDPKQAISYFQQAEKLWRELVEEAPQYAEYLRNLEAIHEKISANKANYKSSP